MENKVSIIIPNYNRADYLEQALKSVRGQTYSHWEALVVDDGSTDDSKQCVAQFFKMDTRVQWMERAGDLKGAAVCRNLGIDKSKGDYIIFLDSDDLLAPHCLEERVAVMENNRHLDFAVFKMQFFKNLPGDDQRIWNLESEESALNRFLKLDAVWQTSGPIWKRDALQKIQGFNPNLKCWQDIDIHLRALFGKLTYNVCYHLPVDCYYRKDSTDSISQTTTNSREKLQSKIELFFWVQKQAKEHKIDCAEMAINILVSSLNGRQYQVFGHFYKKVKNIIPKRTKNVLYTMWMIRKLRLKRLGIIRNKFQKLKNSIISENTIGIYHV